MSTYGSTPWIHVCISCLRSFYYSSYRARIDIEQLGAHSLHNSARKRNQGGSRCRTGHYLAIPPINRQPLKVRQKTPSLAFCHYSDNLGQSRTGQGFQQGRTKEQQREKEKEKEKEKKNERANVSTRRPHYQCLRWSLFPYPTPVWGIVLLSLFSWLSWPGWAGRYYQTSQIGLLKLFLQH